VGISSAPSWLRLSQAVSGCLRLSHVVSRYFTSRRYAPEGPLDLGPRVRYSRVGIMFNADNTRPVLETAETQAEEQTIRGHLSNMRFQG